MDILCLRGILGKASAPVEQLPSLTANTRSHASPNPFAEILVIQYQVTEKNPVDLAVYDLMGKPVAHLVKGQLKDVGQHQAILNGSRLPAGTYFYHLRIGKQQYSGKVIKLNNPNQ